MRGRRVLQGVALQHAHVVPIEVQHTRTETLQDEAWRSLMLQICPTLAPMGPWQESSKKPRVRWSLRTAISVFPPNRLVFFLILIRLRLARINPGIALQDAPHAAAIRATDHEAVAFVATTLAEGSVQLQGVVK